MQNRVRYVFAAVVIMFAMLPAGCEKEKRKEPVSYDDAAFLQDGLMGSNRLTGETIPFRGSFTGEKEVSVPVVSFSEAKELFKGLFSPTASVEDNGDRIVWHLTDARGGTQGDAVFVKGSGKVVARLDLPLACSAVRSVLYMTPDVVTVTAVDPDVREDLEDNYYYGAIVNISDHGCGSGKFVVLREYNFNNGACGMAIRLDSRRWHDSEMSQGSTEHDIADRASCLATMKTAGAIIRSDWNVITKQLTNAGSIIPNQHFYSADRHWTGRHYYYCFHDEETDTIGPFNDLEFYEAWIYWFQPSGKSIYFW